MIAEALVLAGAVLTLLAAIGTVRLRDVMVRMHALSKASTLGVLLALGGAALHLDDPNDVTSLVLAAVLQLVTGPVAANASSRAAWRAEGGGVVERADAVRDPAVGPGREEAAPG